MSIEMSFVNVGAYETGKLACDSFKTNQRLHILHKPNLRYRV